MSAVIYQIGGGDKCLILDTRQAFIYPFTAPSWIDIRVGFYLSICQPAGANNGLITGLAETLVTTGVPADRYWIGLKTNNTTLPNTASIGFVGYNNAENTGTPSAISSTVVSSDFGTGVTNTNFWRAPGVTPGPRFGLVNGSVGTSANVVSGYIHFPQSAGGAGGNAVLVLFRVTRPSGASTTMTITCFFSTPSVDYLYDSTCLIPTIRSAFRTAAYSGSATAPVADPLDALFAYWPYTLSKLRIHALCIEKFA